MMADTGQVATIKGLPASDLANLIQELTEQMHTAAAELKFEVAARLRATAECPVLVQANAGVPELREGKVIYQQDAEAFGQAAVEMVRAGAALVGGCCGTAPAHGRGTRRQHGPVRRMGPGSVQGRPRRLWRLWRGIAL